MLDPVSFSIVRRATELLKNSQQREAVGFLPPPQDEDGIDVDFWRERQTSTE